MNIKKREANYISIQDDSYIEEDQTRGIPLESFEIFDEDTSCLKRWLIEGTIFRINLPYF
jgi:hypothetical protein